MYRLLALDLDGTLLRRDGVVDDRDIAAIGELQAAGVIVTIVTGRLHSGATFAAQACRIDGAIGCVDGSHLVELTSGRTLLHHGMTADLVAVVRDTVARHELSAFVFDAAGIHHDHAGAPYADFVLPFIISGAGMALFFAPVANVVLSSVKPEEEGQASGANNAIRELGGVFGVAVLASIFAHYGGYGTGESFVNGMTPAIWVGAVVVGLGAVAALMIPPRRRPVEVDVLQPVLDEAA